VIELASKITVEQLLKRDMFDRRMAEGKPIYLHEFLYPLLQGYDSVAMKIDGEIGGNDQMFNMLCGRDLIKEILHKEKFVITTKLLTDATGKKMGKTEGNIVSFLDKTNEMFGKVMSWTDGMILNGFELCTNVSMEEIKELEKSLAEGMNPRDLKLKLASEIVKVYYGAKEAKKAEENFIATFSKKEIPDDVSEITAANNELLSEVLLRAKIIVSKNEFKRLVAEGAVKWLENNELVSDIFSRATRVGTLKVGKKRFLKINMK